MPASLATAARVLLATLALAAGAGAAAPSEQALTEAKLKDLRARIAAASASMQATESSRQGELAAVRALDEAQALIAAAASARAIEAAEVADARAHVAQQRDAMARQVALQQQRLTGLVRLAYAGGRGEAVRALFDRDGSDRTLRQLGYLRVLKREREQRIRRLLADARRLDHLEQASRAADRVHALASRIDALQAARLAAQRERHDAALRALREQLAAQRDVLGQLARDERALMELLERLTDILADVRTDLARQTAGSALRRGRLPWPVAGSIAQGFGATLAPGRTSDGILIVAKRGTHVKAVGHGRVAFADWLKGYGLLLIVDHGDGVMSLYAHNESLARDVGDWVEAGDIVATVGNSGGHPEAALYFEMRQHSRPQDPVGWLERR